MAITKNPYAAYNQNKILTATPAELTLMLYDGAIKFNNIAMKAIDDGDIEKAYINITKVRDIISEFQITLNRDYPVAEDFDNVYKYIKQRLHDANMTKDKEILEEVSTHLHTMRDTWKQVMDMTKLAKAN